MALPNYVQAARPNMTQKRWQDLNPDRRDRLKARYAPQPAAAPAPAPQPAATPYVPPQEPQQDFADPFYGSGYNQTYGPSSDVINHPFYDPNSNYIMGGERGERQTPWSELGTNSLAYMNYATEHPDAYYLAHLSKQGLGGLDARSQTAKGLFRDYYAGYEAAKATGTQDIWWPEYMGGQDVQGTLRMMSNEQLGIDDTRYNARTRWGMRGGY